MWTREKLVIIVLLVISIVIWFVDNEMTTYLYTENEQTVILLQQAKSEYIINNGLKLQLLEEESYTNIASKAARKGFIPGQFINF